MPHVVLAEAVWCRIRDYVEQNQTAAEEQKLLRQEEKAAAEAALNAEREAEQRRIAKERRRLATSSAVAKAAASSAAAAMLQDTATDVAEEKRLEEDEGLDFEEFCELEAEAGVEKLTLAELQQKFKKIDEDGSGKITMSELMEFQTKQ
eukprot:SAG31_NODE_152_length_22216_cov_16.550029_10_plen_149_part_00